MCTPKPDCHCCWSAHLPLTSPVQVLCVLGPGCMSRADCGRVVKAGQRTSGDAVDSYPWRVPTVICRWHGECSKFRKEPYCISLYATAHMGGHSSRVCGAVNRPSVRSFVCVCVCLYVCVCPTLEQQFSAITYSYSHLAKGKGSLCIQPDSLSITPSLIPVYNSWQIVF